MREEQKHGAASGDHALGDVRAPEGQPAKKKLPPLDDDEGYDTVILSALLDT